MSWWAEWREKAKAREDVRLREWRREQLSVALRMCVCGHAHWAHKRVERYSSLGPVGPDFVCHSPGCPCCDFVGVDL
jgi:hypothetical protein